MKLYIDGNIFANFSEYVIDLKYNAVASSFRFTSLRDILPNQLKYYTCEIKTDNDELILTGQVVNDTRSISATPELISISGYSLPGILEDCNIPPELYPLQVDNLSLKQICDKILPKFGIEYVADKRIERDFNKSYKKSNAGISMPVKSFINSMASQAGIIMSHNEKGEIVFTNVDTSSMLPIASYEQGNEGINSITVSTDGQALHSHITIMKQASQFDKSAGQETIENIMIPVYRPKVKTSNSGSVFDLKKAARMEMSKELSSIKFQIETKKFVKPGNLISVKAPGLNINNFIELFVERTNIRGSKDSEIYLLTAVLPEVYDFKDLTKNIFS